MERNNDYPPFKLCRLMLTSMNLSRVGEGLYFYVHAKGNQLINLPGNSGNLPGNAWVFFRAERDVALTLRAHLCIYHGLLGKVII